MRADCDPAKKFAGEAKHGTAGHESYALPRMYSSTAESWRAGLVAWSGGSVSDGLQPTGFRVGHT